MANEIKTTISIDVSDGEAKLKKLGDTGAAALKQIDDQAKATAKSLNDVLVRSVEESFKNARTGALSVDALKQAQFQSFITPPHVPRPPAPTPPLAPPATPLLSGDAFNQLKSAFSQLEKALSGAGISFGLLSTAMAAAEHGSVALAAAIVGGLVVAFEKATDSANDAANRLGAFTGSLASGKAAFAELETLGKQLKVSATSLAPAMAELLKAGIEPEARRDMLTNLVRSFQSDRVPIDKAMEEIASLLADIEKGPLSPERLSQVGKVSPRTEQALRAGIQREEPGAIERGDVSQAAVRRVLQSRQFADDIKKNLEDTAQDADSINTAWEHFKTATENLAKAIGGGSNIVSGLLNKAATTLEQDAKDIEAIYGVLKKLLSIFGTLSIGEVTPPGVGPEADKAKADAQAEAKRKADAAAAERDKIIPLSIAAQSAILNRRQAELDLKFLPEEQASQTARDTLGVERAGLAVEQAHLGAADAAKQMELASLSSAQAMIGVRDASKQMALAMLAPQQAAVALASAQNNLTQIQQQNVIRRLGEQGRDISPDSGDPDVMLARQRIAQAQRKAQDIAEKQAEVQVQVAEVNLKYAGNEVAKAELAQKRAAIELKYSFLDEDKAALGAKQAQIAIKSAAIEESDAKLKLAKDTAGQPIARDLAALKYDQAILDEGKAQTALAQKQLLTLEQIRERLGGAAAGATQVKRDALGNVVVDESGQPVLQRQEGGGGQKAEADKTALEKFNDALNTAKETLDKFTGAVAGAQQAADSLVTSEGNAASAADQLAVAANNATTALNTIQPGVVARPQTGAAGGYISGAGTGTSDSIAAWLSNGEFVVSARATEHYGAGLLHALNSMQVPRFNVGGLAGLMSPRMPRFAVGGMVSANGGMPHLGTVDLRTDHGSVTMLASNSAVDQLSRLAVTKRMTSTGRKPGFIAG